MSNILKMIDVYTDIKNIDEILEYVSKDFIKGFTTNPTLVRKGGNKHYLEFAKEAVSVSGDLPISLEIIADEESEMRRQAEILSSIGKNVFVKIPIINTHGISTLPLIRRLLDDKISVNVTAIFTTDQVIESIKILNEKDNCILSVFAGRIADTGVDPVPLMKFASDSILHLVNTKLLWASPREILNIVHAINTNCDIITATPEVLSKVNLLNKDLFEFSKETVTMFYNDAKESNFFL